MITIIVEVVDEEVEVKVHQAEGSDEEARVVKDMLELYLANSGLGEEDIVVNHKGRRR